MKIKFQTITSEEEALKAVESNGYALKYVKDQTEAVCLKAVQRNRCALQYVKDQALFLKIADRLGIEVDLG